MDAALLNLLLTIALLAATFAFRKRILAALGRLLFDGAVKFVGATLIEEGTQVGEDGEKRAYVRLRPRGEALVAAVVPVLVAQAAKSIKLKLPAGGQGLPPGVDLGNLTEALPAILNSGLVPKRYAGLVALAAPFLQGFLGGGKSAGPERGGGTTANPFLKELKP